MLRPRHPTGVKPSGNAFLCPHSLRPSLGSLSSLGRDSDLVSFASSYLCVRDVCRLSGCSRQLFAVCNHIDIWRQFAMHEILSVGEKSKAYTLDYNGSWKRTAIRSFLRAEKCSCVEKKLSLLPRSSPRLTVREERKSLDFPLLTRRISYGIPTALKKRAAFLVTTCTNPFGALLLESTRTGFERETLPDAKPTT